MSISRTKMLQVSKCLIGLAVMVLQSCDITDNRRDLLCGNWESVEGKPDVLIYKEGEAYKVTVFKRSGIRRKLKPETYLLQEENGNLFMNTGFRIDVSYNEATDILTFSPNGDYVLSLIHIYTTKGKGVRDSRQHRGVRLPKLCITTVSYTHLLAVRHHPIELRGNHP